jgi:Spy/CpxP family protein refolding chaperone
MDAMLRAALDNDRVKAALNLTDQQVARLRQSLVDTEKATVKTRADIEVGRIELRELMRADKPDRDAVMRKVQEISDLQGQMMKQRVDALVTAKTVLTPEQQKKIRAFMESRAAMRWRGGERRQGGMGPGRRGGATQGPKPPTSPGGTGTPPTQ